MSITYCDASLFSALISRLTKLQELYIVYECFHKIPTKTTLQLSKAIWELHAVNLQLLLLTVDPYIEMDILGKPTARLLNLHTLILYLEPPPVADIKCSFMSENSEGVLRLLELTSRQLRSLQ
jgi:hypothetical protein